MLVKRHSYLLMIMRRSGNKFILDYSEIFLQASLLNYKSLLDNIGLSLNDLLTGAWARK